MNYPSRRKMFLVHKYDQRKKRCVFYMALGLKKKGMDVLAFWLYDRVIERDFIYFKEFGDLSFEYTTYECCVRNIVFYDRNETVGWIEPSGRFYPCEQCSHSNFAYWYFGKEERALEREGFVKVQYNNPTLRYAECDKGIVTEAQWQELQKLGFSEDDLSNFSVVN